MYYKKNETKVNYQLYRCYLINACLAFFLAFLGFEMLLLSYKFFNYNIDSCILSEYKIQKLTKSSNLTEIYNQCWINGIEREKFGLGMNLGDVDKGFGQSYDDETITNLRFKEKRRFQSIAYFSFIVILIQIVFYCLQKKFNYFLPIIKRLKERSIMNYCTNDRQFISLEIQRLMEKSNTYFWIAIMFKLIYFVSLIIFICIYKFILLGQFTNLNFDLLDYDFWLNLIMFPANKSPENGISNGVVSYGPVELANILNSLFQKLWLLFIVILCIYIVLILTRLLEYLLPNLRTRTILLFAPNCDKNLIKMLNSEIGNYFLLHKMARNITPFRFNLLIETVFYVKENELQDLDEIINQQTNSILESNDIKKEQINSEKQNEEQSIYIDDVKMLNRKKNEQHFIDNQNYDKNTLQQSNSFKSLQKTDHFRLSQHKQQNVSSNQHYDVPPNQNYDVPPNQNKLNNTQEVNVVIEHREENS